MTKTLRILHLEDSVPDRELVRAALEGPTTTGEFIYAASMAGFAAALEREKFDLILSDFTLPGYDGASALALAQAKSPEVPYVFVSGTIGEEQAIELLKSGATDYVLKQRLQRLPSVVQRALREAGERARRREAEEVLRQSEERFREMAECIGDVFYIAVPDTADWSYASPAYEQIWGRPLSGLYAQPARWIDAVRAEDRAKVIAAHEQLSRGEEYRIDYRIQRPDGTQRWIEDRCYLIREPSGKLKHAVGVATDITQRRQLEAQLLQAQKMEAVGQLAGGVAHDFNNVLTVVIGYARLLLDGGTLPPDMIGPLTQIYTAGNRAANLTRQLLVFSRKQTVDRHIIDLNQVAFEFSDMLRRLIGETITLELALSAAPCRIEADAGMMEQVLMNLVVNARDAMRNGGALTIATEPVTITDAATRHHPEARPGEFICLSVRDTGCGIPPENHQRIFEPFFTTKEVGQGTGLGLAMVFGIVQQHQGWIELESAEGAGTCIRILLPTAPPALEASVQHPAKTAFARSGSETLLLVEDDPAVREFAVAVLRSQGYRVLQATSGIDALEVWKWHQARIALLVTDLVLPDGLGGMELAARLRREKPALKVVLTSGYENEVSGAEFRPPAGTHFIHKPYKPQSLAQIVSDAFGDNYDR